MADIVFLATIVAFFMLCVGYVAVCGRIIGPDDISIVDDRDERRRGRRTSAWSVPHERRHRRPSARRSPTTSSRSG